MQRTALIAFLVLGVIAAACGSAAARTEGQDAGKATLGLGAPAPLTIRGTRFESRERVRLIVVTRKKITKRLTASQSGTFVVRFRGLAVDRCQGFSAFALGSQGSRASLSLPNVYCPPRP